MHFTRPRRAKPLLVVLAVVLAGAVLAYSAASTSAGTTETASSAVSAQKLKAFNAKTAAEFRRLTAKAFVNVPKTGPKAASGKSIIAIPCGMAAEGCSRPAQGVVEAAKAIGWDAQIIDPQFDPSKQAAAVEKAISLGADGIYLGAIDSRNILGQLQQAKREGIKLVCYYCEDKAGVYDAKSITPAFIYRQGRAAAVAAYVLGGSKLRVLLLEDPSFSLLANRTKAIRDFVAQCKRAGGDCSVLGSQKYLTAELQTKVPGLASNLARRYPTWTAIIGPYGSAVPFIVQGLTEAGLAKPPKISVGYDSDGASIQLMRTGNFYVADFGLGNPPAGWIAVDDLNRLFQGRKPTNLLPPNKLLTKANVPKKGSWEGDNVPAYKQQYKKLWGVG